MSLTPKREAFAIAFVETGNGSEAYRRSFKAENMSAPAIAVEASRLLDDPNVSLRVKELQGLNLERHKVTVDSLLIELEEARIAASTGERPQAAAMVAATLGKAKLLGLEAAQKVELGGAVAVLGKEEYKQARKEMLGNDDC